MYVVTCEEVYPYKYTDCCENLDEMSLSSKEKLYSSFYEWNITNIDYEYAMESLYKDQCAITY